MMSEMYYDVVKRRLSCEKMRFGGISREIRLDSGRVSVAG